MTDKTAFSRSYSLDHFQRLSQSQNPRNFQAEFEYMLNI